MRLTPNQLNKPPCADWFRSPKGFCLSTLVACGDSPNAQSQKPEELGRSEFHYLHHWPSASPALYGMSLLTNSCRLPMQKIGLNKSRNYRICATHTDGRPHSIPVWSDLTLELSQAIEVKQ